MSGNQDQDNMAALRGKPRVPQDLAAIICGLAILPAVLVAAFVVGSLTSAVRTGIAWGQTAESLLLLVWITAGLAITLVGLDVPRVCRSAGILVAC